MNGKKIKTFIDLSKIKDIVIHEVQYKFLIYFKFFNLQWMTPYDINYYLFVVPKNAQKLITPFDVRNAYN